MWSLTILMDIFFLFMQTGQDSMVGDGSQIAEKVGIKRSVIGNHCSIGKQTKVTNSVIMDHVTVGEG